MRLQHRGGRLWVLNSRALDELQVTVHDHPRGLERIDGSFTGRLYEGDTWLRERIVRQPPDLARASRLLASYGVTGATDTTPDNDSAAWSHFQAAQARGELLQRVRMMGGPEIAHCNETASLTRGEYKVHLLESRLPALDSLCNTITSVHGTGRAVAIHCVTLTELVFALHALASAGVRTGDRIEHASVCSPELLPQIRAMGLRIVTQAHFIEERGDRYLVEVDPAELPWLYRAATFIEAGIPLAGGTDAPFGGANPWRSMRAAVERGTRAGTIMGAAEALTPEQALDLYLSPAEAPGAGPRTLGVGCPADLCLLHAPWDTLRDHLDVPQVRRTWSGGTLIHAAP